MLRFVDYRSTEMNVLISYPTSTVDIDVAIDSACNNNIAIESYNVTLYFAIHYNCATKSCQIAALYFASINHNCATKRWAVVFACAVALFMKCDITGCSCNWHHTCETAQMG